MGNEASTYIRRTVQSMNNAYGDNWHIIERAESPPEDVHPWQVQVGVSRAVFKEDGALGVTMDLECAATVRYITKSEVHYDGQLDHTPPSAFVAVDIAVTLAAWLANNVDEESMVAPKDIEIGLEPASTSRVAGQNVAIGRYVSHVFWTAPFDQVSQDIEIVEIETGHPVRNVVVEEFYWELEFGDGSKRVIRSGEQSPQDSDAAHVRQIIFADPDDIPATTDTQVYYPAIAENIGALMERSIVALIGPDGNDMPDVRIADGVTSYDFVSINGRVFTEFQREPFDLNFGVGLVQVLQSPTLTPETIQGRLTNSLSGDPGYAEIDELEVALANRIFIIDLRLRVHDGSS